MRDIAGLYSSAAPIYAEQGPPYFGHAGQRLVELSEVQTGDRVLDIATGRGAVLLAVFSLANIALSRCPPASSTSVDIAPTVLALLGLPALPDADDRVLAEALVGGPEPTSIDVRSEHLALAESAARLRRNWVGATAYLDSRSAESSG